MKHGKKYMETAKAVDRAKLYDPDEAIALAKKSAVPLLKDPFEIHRAVRSDLDAEM